MVRVICMKMMVGVTGFEPVTARSQSGCATGLRYTPRYKTYGQTIRRNRRNVKLAEIRGFEPLDPFEPLVFETSAIDRSARSPCGVIRKGDELDQSSEEETCTSV